MNIDLTVIISLILGILAIISPSISAIIDNRYKFKMKKFERYNDIRDNTINNLIDVTFKCGTTSFSIEEFYIALNKVLMYVDEIFSKKLGKIKYLIENKQESNVINSALMDFIIYLNSSEQIKSKKQLSIMHIFHK